MLIQQLSDSALGIRAILLHMAVLVEQDVLELLLIENRQGIASKGKMDDAANPEYGDAVAACPKEYRRLLFMVKYLVGQRIERGIIGSAENQFLRDFLLVDGEGPEAQPGEHIGTDQKRENGEIGVGQNCGPGEDNHDQAQSGAENDPAQKQFPVTVKLLLIAGVILCNGFQLLHHILPYLSSLNGFHPADIGTSHQKCDCKQNQQQHETDERRNGAEVQNCRGTYESGYKAHGQAENQGQ